MGRDERLGVVCPSIILCSICRIKWAFSGCLQYCLARQGKLLQEYLAGLGGRHVSVQEIAESLPEKVGISTIYRQLEKLEARGLVRKYINDGEPACYQYADDGIPGCHGHLHLKCGECGRLIHLECEEFDRLAEHLFREHGFRTDPLRTSIIGTCRDCLAKEDPA